MNVYVDVIVINAHVYVQIWLVAWLTRDSRPFETLFQSISSGLRVTGRKKREKNGGEKKCSNKPTRTYCKHSKSS